MTCNGHSEVLKFWFPNDKYQEFWFQGKVNHKLNQTIKIQFSETLEKAEKGLLECKTIDDMLSHIILFDQLTRSIYLDNRNRNLDKALKLSLQLLDKINDFPIAIKIDQLEGVDSAMTELIVQPELITNPRIGHSSVHLNGK